MRPRIGVRLVAAGLAVFVAVGEAAQPRSESQRAVRAGEDLYKSGNYKAAAERFDASLAADSRNAEALLFGGLAALRQNDPKKAADLWGRLQRDAADPNVAAEAGRMRTILLREVAERAAKEAVAQERQLAAERTDPRAIAVATFRNAGTGEFATLGKALAAMLIDNLSALPNVRVLERERVQALEQESALAASGIVEKTTAVRAGKLLRAGRVTAGTHTDWTASPTHLALNALLVDVDAGKTIAEGKSEALATEFFKLVPDVATTFSGALGEPVAQLPSVIRQRVEKPHTQSLPAVLAFGRALDALDRHDAEGAKQACKDVEKADPNFELAKKTCAFIPVTWLSLDGIVAAMEPTAFAMAGTTTAAKSGSLWPAAVGAAALGGAIAGGFLAYRGGGHDGGSGGPSGPEATPVPPGIAAPNLTGVGNVNVVAGATATIDMQCSDPDGTVTTISNPTAGPGGTFTEQSGTTSSARYQQPTSANQAGQSFPVTFLCTDTSSPPSSTRRDATIHVSAPSQQNTPVPQSTSPPQITPQPPGQAAPNLTGVEDRSVIGGATATIDMQCSDPDGTVTTITNPIAGPGGAFTAQSGVQSTGHYEQATAPNQNGQSFAVSFVCTDSNVPPMSTQRDATIHVVAPATPTFPPPPPVTPTPALSPTPEICSTIGETCAADDDCCVDQGICSGDVCCLDLLTICNPSFPVNPCCTGVCSLVVIGESSDFRCCLETGSFCGSDANCCSGSCVGGQCFGA